MALSIRNAQAEKLAREVARVSGENLTQAVIHALEERLRRLRGRRMVRDLEKEILAISKRCSTLPELDSRSPDEILGYNKTGGLS